MNDILIKLNTKSEHCENCRNYIPAIESQELYIDDDSTTRAWKIELG